MSFVIPPSGCERGFTILEVLVAVAVFAMICAIVFGSLLSTSRVLNAVQEASDWDGMARSSLEQLAADLSMAMNEPPWPWIGRNGYIENRASDRLAFLTAAQIGTASNVRQSGVGRVVYAVDGGRLVRWGMGNLQGVLTTGVTRAEIATNVKAFNVRYYDGRIAQWLDEWDTTVLRVLPQAVAVELVLANATGSVRTYRTWMPVAWKRF